MKLYTILNENDFVEYASYFEEGTQPINAIPELLTFNFIKPKFNFSTRTFEEMATPQEIEAYNRKFIPESISRMNLNIQLLLRNITMISITQAIDDIPDSMFPLIEKKIAKIKFAEAVTFDRYNADLNLVATLMGLTQIDLDNIFLNGNS